MDKNAKQGDVLMGFTILILVFLFCSAKTFIVHSTMTTLRRF